LLFLRADVFGFRSHEAPNFIALEASNLEITDSAIMITRTRAAKIGKQFNDCVLACARHPNSGANGTTFDEAANNLGAGLGVEAIHTDSYTKAALACQGNCSTMAGNYANRANRANTPSLVFIWTAIRPAT
jgi:hypothetical protein